MDQQTITTYNKLASDYDKETVDFWERFPDTIITNFANSVSGEKRVLNLGSGPGRDGLLLEDKGMKITRLDASSAMIKLCRERGLKAIKGDLLSTPFEGQMFDGVWAYTSLLHIRKSEMRAALLEIRRILKDSGVLGLGMIEGDGELYRESSEVDLPRLFVFYSKNELEELLKENGFKVVYFERFKPKSKSYLNHIMQKD